MLPPWVIKKQQQDKRRPRSRPALYINEGRAQWEKSQQKGQEKPTKAIIDFQI